MLKTIFAKPRLLLFLTFVASIALIGAGYYAQFVLKQKPCPLCIVQRYEFILIGFIGLAGALLGGQRRAFKFAAWAGLCASLFGLITAAYHQYRIATPGVECMGDPIEQFINGLPFADWLPELFFAMGNCADPYPPLLGLSVPIWAMLWFVLFAGLFIWLLRLPPRHPGRSRFSTDQYTNLL